MRCQRQQSNLIICVKCCHKSMCGTQPVHKQTIRTSKMLRERKIYKFTIAGSTRAFPIQYVDLLQLIF